MNKIILTLSIVSLSISAFAQTYNSPESIEFDYANNRWLIANNTGGNILSRNSASGALSVFTVLPVSPHGLEIVGNTLYVCDGGFIRGYDLTTASAVMNLNLGAAFLNGLTHDNNGNLYATDFTSKTIYRINIANQQFNIFVPSTVLTKSPNGIVFDQPNNRCVFVNWGANAPIMAVSLTDSTVSTIATTTLRNCDGIAKDAAGNYYVSVWGLTSTSGTINKFTSFPGTPTVVVTGLNSPADIFYNTLTDTLGVPNSGTSGGTAGLQNNTTYHYFGSATGINDEPLSTMSLSVNPNPVVKAAEINYEMPDNGMVVIQLFDLKGSLVKTIVNENQSKGKQTTFFSKSGLSAGTYLLTIKTDTKQETKKIIIAE